MKALISTGILKAPAPTFSLLAVFAVLALQSASCAGVQGARMAPPSEVYLFNGISVEKVSVAAGRLDVEGKVAAGLHGVLFFVGKGHYPEMLVFRSTGAAVDSGSPVLRILPDHSQGVLAGVVFKPVRGGKLRPRAGIAALIGGASVRIQRAGFSQTVIADKDGKFAVALPSGEYNLSAGDGQAAIAVIRPGETTIQNISKGMVLID